MTALGVPVVTLGFGVFSAALILVGGIVLFAAGRGRGTLAGAGFVVLAVGTVTGSAVAMLAPVVVEDLEVSARAFSTAFTVVQLLIDLVGWGLVIVAVAAAARSTPQRPPGPQAAPPPGPPGH